ncbi:restriction system-associated AAA family ATPase [Chryseobacterium bernardetii]|uniref:restriction system-associated AAA family ATPase n=1 Tax=Chryseobacterium bernardetii TaxID=1241978 RepID=UPI000F515221|nr:restriction system-associated AAA family ATPase [Chryseobacterium bernardetii]AZB34799.1 restriction system-associated AAA family ATPase [Chryseobacterium bernardetii]
MKLQFLKLHNKYRSLEPFEYEFLKHPLLKDRVDPMCLVGLNGSGKSNFLELLADIFYEVETFFLSEQKLYKKDSPKYFPYSSNKSKEKILFELRYKIAVQGVDKEIKIERSSSTLNKIQFFIKENKMDLFDSYEYIELDNDLARNYIPLVVSYTSGLNDLLTLPFIDLQDYYAQQVAQEAISTMEAVEKIPSPNMLLLNYDSNSSIVISNFLLADQNKIKIFKETLRIEKINSFRIVIRLNKLYGNKKVEVTSELQEYIDNLGDCSSLSDINIDEKKGSEYVFDFVVNNTTKSLFKEKFGTAQKLFEALTKLNLLNTLCVKKDNRILLRKKREKGQLIKFPQTASLDKVFSIENIELILSKPLVRTEYEKISDGEHQFIHIIGGILLFDEKKPTRDLLYLLDEPDTHFNPLWRSDFFYQLQKVLINKSVEFVITTHSPFILSDCHGYNVFKFTRIEDKVTFDRVKIETYGATYENVTENIFEIDNNNYKHFDSRIAKLAYNDIQQILEEISKIENKEIWLEKYDNLMKRIKMLGESVDRLYIMNEFTEKNKKFNSD